MSIAKRVAVRSAVSADAKAISAIYNAAIAERGSTFETEPRCAEDFAARIGKERFSLLVAEADDGVIGWASLVSYSDRACYSGIGEASV
jgi:L-amino acid N-acyltransferase YncA